MSLLTVTRVAAAGLALAVLSLPACGGEVVGTIGGWPDSDDLVDDGVTPGIDEPGDGATDPEQEPPPPLTLTSLSPARGPATGGTEVTLEGAGFGPDLEVRFGGVPAALVTVLSGELARAISPEAAMPGLVDVTLRVPASGEQFTDPGGFLYEPAVQLLSVEPNHIQRLGGGLMILSGRGFDDDTLVIVGDRLALESQVVDDETMTVLSPGGAALGWVDVHVASDRGVATLRDAARVVDVPALTAVHPVAAVVGEHVAVEVEGDALLAPATFRFGGIEAISMEPGPGSGWDVVLAPPGGAGTVDVQVTTPFGASELGGAFTWISPADLGIAAIHAVTPAAGPIDGGQEVSIVVTGLVDPDHTTVSFGDRAAEIHAFDAAGNVVVVGVPPAEEIGPVDVSVTVGDQERVAPAAYRYEVALRVFEVSPPSGPADGGTAVTISGAGIEADAQLQIGALPGQDVVVLDDSTITAGTPPGSPGLADVVVTLSDGVSTTLFGGFAFTAPLDVWAVAPDFGSPAGGALVEILGSGLDPSCRVWFGGVEAEVVSPLSPTRLLIRTPPGRFGSVDVTVESVEQGASVTRRNAFTYFDPNAPDGGTWGGLIDRTLNVAVRDAGTGQPMEGAFVTLGSNANTPLQGYTDGDGLITFSELDLGGKQTVTATFKGFSTASIVEFDATNVSLGLDMAPPCADPNVPCNQASSLFNGRVVNPFKGVHLPWAQCDDLGWAPVGWCEPCVVDADCAGSGLRCSDLFDQGHRCTASCDATTPCAEGFQCQQLPDQVPSQCVPSAGVPGTWCVSTLDPQQKVIPNDDGEFTLGLGLGSYAVACWSGIWNGDDFTPQVLGVLRGQGAYEAGDVVDGTIEMNHPVNRDIRFVLDRPRVVDDPDLESTWLSVTLNLGADGDLEVPGFGGHTGDAPHEGRVLDGLTGDLYDAAYDVSAFFYVATLPNGGSATWLRHVSDFGQDRGLRLAADAGGELEWQRRALGLPGSVHAVAGTAAGALAVGEDGMILHSIGDAWAFQAGAPPGVTLHAAHVGGDGTAMVGGEAGTALVFDGLLWQPRNAPVEETIESVFVVDAGRAWAVAGDQVLRFDGADWDIAWTAPARLHAVVATGADDVWLAGDGGYVGRLQGAGWHALPTGTDSDLQGLALGPHGVVHAVGSGGTALTMTTPVDGGAATVELHDTPTTHELHAAWSDGLERVVAVGDLGTVIHLEEGVWVDRSNPDHRSHLLAVGGRGESVWALGSHDVVMGPMLAIPTDFTPTNMGLLEGTVGWERPEDSAAPDAHMLQIRSNTPCSMEICGMFLTAQLMRDEWAIIAPGHVTSIELPDLRAMTPASGMEPGMHTFAVNAVRLTEPTSLDDFILGDVTAWGRWSAWAYNSSTLSIQ